MTKTKFTNHKGEEFLFVELPKDFDELGDIETNIKGEKFLSYFTENEREDIWIELPKCNWQIIAPLSEMNEELWKQVVKQHNNNSFKNYGYVKKSANEVRLLDAFNESRFKTATESGESLLKSLNIIVVNPYKKPTGEDYYYNSMASFDEQEMLWDKESYDKDLKQFEEAQQNLFNGVLIKKVK
jgi:hypothetical protein